MKTLEQIKNEYAQSKGYDNYLYMIDYIIANYGISSAVYKIEEITNNLLILVQQEQQKVIAESAQILVQDGGDYEAIGHGTSINGFSVKVYKQSIINDKNIIR